MGAMQLLTNDEYVLSIVFVSPIGRKLLGMLGNVAFFLMCIKWVAVNDWCSGTFVLYASLNLVNSSGCIAVSCDSSECVIPSGPAACVFFILVICFVNVLYSMFVRHISLL